MRKLLIVITFIVLSSCAYKAEIDSRSTMASCDNIFRLILISAFFKPPISRL